MMKVTLKTTMDESLVRHAMLALDEKVRRHNERARRWDTIAMHAKTVSATLITLMVLEFVASILLTNNTTMWIVTCATMSLALAATTIAYGTTSLSKKDNVKNHMTDSMRYVAYKNNKHIKIEEVHTNVHQNRWEGEKESVVVTYRDVRTDRQFQDCYGPYAVENTDGESCVDFNERVIRIKNQQY